MRSLLDEGISKPLDGSVSTPHALPRHSPLCHRANRLQNLHILWSDRMSCLETCIYTVNICIHSSSYTAKQGAGSTQQSRHRPPRSNGRWKLWTTSNYRATLKYDPGEVLVRPNRGTARAPINRILCTLTVHPMHTPRPVVGKSDLPPIIFALSSSHAQSKHTASFSNPNQLWAWGVRVAIDRIIHTVFTNETNALCAESEVRKAVERSSYAVALKFPVFFFF